MYYSWDNEHVTIANCNVKGSINAGNASAVNGATLRGSSCTVDYENTSCDIYLNGIRKTALDDYSL